MRAWLDVAMMVAIILVGLALLTLTLTMLLDELRQWGKR